MSCILFRGMPVCGGRAAWGRGELRPRRSSRSRGGDAVCSMSRGEHRLLQNQTNAPKIFNAPPGHAPKPGCRKLADENRTWEHAAVSTHKRHLILLIAQNSAAVCCCCSCADSRLPHAAQPVSGQLCVVPEVYIVEVHQSRTQDSQHSGSVPRWVVSVRRRHNVAHQNSLHLLLLCTHTHTRTRTHAHTVFGSNQYWNQYRLQSTAFLQVSINYT